MNCLACSAARAGVMPALDLNADDLHALLLVAFGEVGQILEIEIGDRAVDPHEVDDHEPLVAGLCDQVVQGDLLAGRVRQQKVGQRAGRSIGGVRLAVGFTGARRRAAVADERRLRKQTKATERVRTSRREPFIVCSCADRRRLPRRAAVQQIVPQSRQERVGFFADFPVTEGCWVPQLSRLTRAFPARKPCGPRSSTSRPFGAGLSAPALQDVFDRRPGRTRVVRGGPAASAK